LAAMDVVTLGFGRWELLARLRQGRDVGCHLLALLQRQVFAGRLVVWSGDRRRLRLIRIAEAEFVGAGALNEVEEAGRLPLPAKLAGTAVLGKEDPAHRGRFVV